MDEIEKTLPVSFNIKSPIDMAKVNPVGVEEHPYIRSAYENMLQSQKELADSLEKRYEQPNWFKIAAGFAKPQLGGFLASLGSASQAMGENVEAQRAIAPTVARMRAEVAAGQLPLSQRVVQRDAFAEWDKSGRDPKKLPAIIALSPDSPIATAAKEFYAAASTAAGTKSTQLGTTITAQEAAAKHPYIDVNEFLEKSQLGNIEQQKESLIKAIADKGYYSPQDLKLKSVSELTGIASQLNNQFAEKSLENAKTAGEMVDNSTVQLQNLSTARHLASSPKLEKLLGIESGSNAVSALFNWVATNSDGDFSRLSIAARQLAEKDPSAYSEFQILRKALATNLATAREGITNPSVASQALLAQTTPDPRMTREAILKLIDLQANDVNQNLSRARIMSSTKGPNGEQLDPNQLRQSPLYQSITRYSDDRKKAILNGSYMRDRLPDFYSPYYEAPTSQQSQVPGQKPTGADKYKPPKGWKKNPDGSFSKE